MKMKYLSKNSIIICLMFICFTSCKSKQWAITEFSTTKIPIDSSTDAIADKSYEAYIVPFKQNMDAQMNVVIGYSLETMTASKPESLLSNFSADAFREIGEEYLGEKIDLSVVNMGGLRTEIPQGNVTVGDIFRVLPFENELVILWLRGNKLAELCDVFAQVGGEGISGIQMGIKEGKAVNVLVNGQPIDRNKLYSIMTNDYLAGGNDKLVPLGEYEKRLDTGLRMRDTMIEYIIEKTDKGENLHSAIEGRITVL